MPIFKIRSGLKFNAGVDGSRFWIEPVENTPITFNRFDTKPIMDLLTKNLKKAAKNVEVKGTEISTKKMAKNLSGRKRTKTGLTAQHA
jgi:hypothetical protein